MIDIPKTEMTLEQAASALLYCHLRSFEVIALPFSPRLHSPIYLERFRPDEIDRFPADDPHKRTATENSLFITQEEDGDLNKEYFGDLDEPWDELERRLVKRLAEGTPETKGEGRNA